MKITIAFFCLFLVAYSIKAQTNNDLSMNTKVEVGRCTGSRYCTACSTCNYCKYCNSGGSCGVCSPSSSTSQLSKRTSGTSTSYSSLVTSIPNDPSSPYYLKTLKVGVENLNLRKGPGSQYAIIKKLNQDDSLIFLAVRGEWVKVKFNQTEGFVYYKYVSLMDN